ncbi:glycosyltransferase family 4 protein [Marinobacter sp.]|uniref:glycosyltransferase family 4 protein n=1 Tax=Marinobacter sp. TaxID=50741 RepID=UPI000C691409|nr:glycosyltransferase family 4 protein [Marinobacter sp.]MAO13061.1 glycosyl transferase family 1 [Marinobacter sp.]
MKVLQVSTFDLKGGAARAAYRLQAALDGTGLASQLLVQAKSGDDTAVIGPESKVARGMGLLRPTLDLLPTMAYRNRTQTLFSPAWLPFSGLVSQINRLAPDIVHLHWVNGGALSISDIAKIKAPIVWSMHDMWAFTGGCHSDSGCGHFTETCGRCPVLNSDKKRDLSFRVQSRKRRVFDNKTDIQFVGVSSWLANCAKESSLLKKFDVTAIPNPLDTHVFCPVSKSLARELLGLPKNRPLVLFGAMNALADPNKGFVQLKKALSLLQNDEVELVIFGSSQPEDESPFGQRSHYMGYLHDDVALKLLYSAADVMVVPSYQEAFGQTASEAMACGTPVVAFGATGLLDIVDHKVNGYLAEPYKPEDLAAGIKWVLLNSEAFALGDNAVAKVRRCFDYPVVAERFLRLYRELLA